MKNIREKSRLALSAVLLVAVSWAAPSWSEDIDLFVSNIGSTEERPTILLVWDNAANNNANVESICRYRDDGSEPSLGADKSLGMEQCAMVNALLEIRDTPQLMGPNNEGTFNMGLMVYNHNRFPDSPDFPNGRNSGACGYLRFPPAQMSRAKIDELIKTLKDFTSQEIASNTALGDTFAESWAALNGRPASCSGRDYTGLESDALQCRDSVIIFVGNAFRNSNSTDGNNVDVGGLLKKELTDNFGYAAGSPEYELFTTPIAVTGVSQSGNANNKFWADEWARFMKRVNITDSRFSDSNVTSYTISVTDNSRQAQGTINYYAMIARQGGGKTFLVDMNDPDALTRAILRVLNEVQSINSVFASATLPVSANTQGTFLNQIYIAMFRPDPDAEPRWLGNLKQYQMGFDAGNNLVLTDSTYDPEVETVESITNPITGTVTPSAVSFWTTNDPGVDHWPKPSTGSCPSGEGFWKNAPAGAGLACDAPDGDLVEKGGAGQMQRADNLTATYQDANNENSRVLFTCNDVGGCSATLPEFSLANSTLTSDSGNPFGLSGETSGVALQFGEHADQSVHIDCLSGSADHRDCTLTYSGNPAFVAGAEPPDRLLLPGLSRPNCPFKDNVCNIRSRTETTVNFRDDGNDKFEVSEDSVRVAKPSQRRTATMSNHGLVPGEQVKLSACSVVNSDRTHNLPSLPSGGQSQTITVSSVLDKDTFTFTLGEEKAYADESASITCTVTPELTAEKLVRWVRGEDNNAGVGAEDPVGPCPLNSDGSRASDCPITVRPSIHGDVLHSRPAVINYPTVAGEEGDVVVFYGANDGVFRAVNGNQTRNIGGVRPGGELWGFIAPEFFERFERQYKNSPLVSHPGVFDRIEPEPKPYFFDGSPTVLQDRRVLAHADTKGKAFVYLSARRGGRLLYALEVTDKMNPQFRWTLTDEDIPELGQTWSQPMVALLRGYTTTVTDDEGNSVSVAKPVLVMGAGYDPAEDADPGPGAEDASFSNDMGRGIIILDAVTAEVIWAALASCDGVSTALEGKCVEMPEIKRAIAADLTLMDSNNDGHIDRLYAADVGANIWRVDLVSPDIDDWSMHKVAKLGGTGNDARKFLFPPDVIPTTNYDLLVAVSGDREHPLFDDRDDEGLAYNVQNRFYLIKDTKGNIGTQIVVDEETDLVNLDECVDENGEIVDCGSDEAVGSVEFNISDANTKGYFFNFRRGEKGVNAPVSVAGKTFFATNQPDDPEAASGSCTAGLGVARAYTVDFRSGTFTSQLFSGGGLPPTPIAGLVKIGDQTVPFIIGGTGPSPFDPGVPPIDLPPNRDRLYQYFE